MPNKQTNGEGKPAKRYTKTRGEHIKDILIAILITGVLAFVAGMHFSNKHNAEVQRAVQAAQTTAQAQAEVKK